jgi:CheY-like chemotaxis protein
MSEEAAVRRQVAPMNILIVDDEQAIRETCAVVAEQCGMKVTGVATAEEALEILEHSAIDILLTDLKLPRTNGVELLKLVYDLHPQVTVVVLTQYGTIESALEVTRMGAVDYVNKPFRIEELRARLERVARAVELQEENTLLREQLRTRSGFGGLIGGLVDQAAVPERFANRWRELAREIEGGVREEMLMSLPAPRILEGASRPVVDASGHHLGRVEIYRDLTAQRIFQSKLLQTEKLAGLGQMVSGIAHELNNPLTGILGNAELLLAEIRRNDDGKIPYGGQQRVETIAALAVRLRETVRRLSQEWESRCNPLQ